MNTKTQTKIDQKESITIKLPKTVVMAIVEDYLHKRFDPTRPINNATMTLPNAVAEQIVRAHVAADAKQLIDGASAAPTGDATPRVKMGRKSRNNPKPRNERLTGTFAGRPNDFESAPAVINAPLQNTIDEVLSATDLERAKRYTNGLCLHVYNHEVFKWLATIRKCVIGSPVRRYFGDLKAAVTWLELVRERWQTNKLRGNIPQGGVRRDAFRMGWESKDSGTTQGRCEPDPEKSNTPKAKPCSTPWTAERRAKLLADQQDKKAFHSVKPVHQKEKIRPRANTEQILAGVYIPRPMPGNNLATAAANGSTAAVTESSSTGSSLRQPPKAKAQNGRP